MRRSTLLVIALGLAGCDVPDMDSDLPGEESPAWAPGEALTLDEVRERERAVLGEIDEAKRELAEGDRREEIREGWMEVQSARRGEGPFDRWLEGLGAERTLPGDVPERGSERW